MARHSRLACLLTLLAVTSARDQSRWSRQISSYTSDISDWVPLPGPIEREPILPPIKRQAVAEPRILSEPAFPGFSRPTGFSQDAFPSRTYFNSPANRQLYLQSVPAVPSAPQNYLSDQGFRFGLQQPNFPLSQGFVGPQFTFDNAPQPQIKQRPQPQPPQLSNPIKFESFKQGLPLPPQVKPFINQGQKKQEPVKFVDGYRAENVSNDVSSLRRKPQSLQKIKFENLEKIPNTEMIPPNKPKVEREEVQLLYVPVESLNRAQFNFRSPLTSSQLNTESFVQNQRPNPLKQTFNNDFQRPIPKPQETFIFNQRPIQKTLETFESKPDYFNSFNSQYKDLDQIPKFSTLPTPFPTTSQTTPKPKKLKPHQPPLAIFLTQEAKKGSQVKVGDVLSSLKTAETIAVLDSVNPASAPKVFIGPSSLSPPGNFVKFELPYLSNIEHSDKKLRQLPFFVAPLSYNTPQGFAKIPFPSPHVGSVVINAQIRDSTTTTVADVTPNSYSTSPQSYREPKPETPKPSFSYYSTAAPKTNPPPNYQSNYYSFEPQTVSTIRPPKEPQNVIASPPKTGSYFLSNFDEYNPSQVSFEPQNEYKTQEPVKAFNVAQQSVTTQTPRTTISSTTAKPSTYPSQLLETHNPYSINQAFHFSTPLDYHNFFDEGYATPGSSQPPSSSPTSAPVSSTASPSPTPKQIEPVTEKQKYQSSPNYLQNYSPEIHYESDLQSSRYPVYNTNDYTPKPEVSSEYNQPAGPVNNDNTYSISSAGPTEYNGNIETQSPVNENTETVNKESITDTDTLSTRSPYHYNQYETSYEEEKQTTPTTTTTTTSTRRTPIRTRGRPRYTTTPRTDSNESTAKTVVTRRPLRERRPLPTRSRYEPNKITTERATRKPIEYNESTPKYSRNRTRGRVHFKPSDDEYNKPKGHSSKEADLAYQRDVLHQNYPVTLMERTSTVDIEAITEPSPKASSTKIVDEITGEVYDTENAYSNDKASISHSFPNLASKEEITAYTSRSEVQTETPYVPKLHSTRGEEYFQSRSSLAPVDAITYDETSPDKEDDTYAPQTTPVQKYEKPEVVSYATEPSVAFEQNQASYSVNSEYSSEKHEEITTPEVEITKLESHEEEPEENVVQTTPSYNRVRVRPGVIRQYHQASTESTRIKSERKRPVQAVTYRPAFNGRRTTMRIEEIEADLKTKQVHTRPEVQEHRHPVYRPEPTTEQSVTSPSTQDSTTKRGVFRRRRPTYTTTSTEASSTKRSSYEVKSRFRGRRPTEKPTDKPELQTDSSSSTVRNTLYSRYSNRPKLSERYKKPEPEENEDQDSNYSINRPKYAEPESDQWSPKISTDSFKPYNPNDIIDDQKVATTERRSSNDQDDSDLDIITARNEYDDILISVTPATNNRVNKKIPDIPPTLEALVEQSKITKSDSGDNMSTFESMLEEVMKSLEEQDENEYTSNVMKHKGGEIGEIPPERIITSGDNNQKTTTVEQEEPTTVEPTAEDSAHNEDEANHKSRRRGFWKKVKVRPVTESIEAAESQYYSNTVNRLGHRITLTKTVHDKSGKYEKPKIAVTTYKPNFQFIKDMFENDNDSDTNILPIVDIPKITQKAVEKVENIKEEIKTTTEPTLEKETPTEANANPGDMDLGTGSPDPTIAEDIYYTPTEPAPTKSDIATLDRSDGFSFMDYLFGVTSIDDESHIESKKTVQEEKTTEKPADIEITTEAKPKVPTTESSYIPEEITADPSEEVTESIVEYDIKKVNSTEKPNEEEKVVETTEKSVKVETSSISSFMDPTNVVSTSMSTEISHETEICFRGKCIKTSKDIL